MMRFPSVALVIFISSLSYSESFGVNVNAGRSITSKSTRTQILRTRSSQSRFSPSSLRDKWDDLIDDDEVGDPLWQVRTKFDSRLTHVQTKEKLYLAVLY